jgi:hypothetical protein
MRWIEVDEAGVGRAAGVKEDVVGFGIPVAQGEERARVTQLIERGGEFAR